MVELFRSNDPVLLSWAEALLAGEGIDAIVLDQFTSIMEGSIGAIPRRLMVIDEDESRAREVMAAAMPKAVAQRPACRSAPGKRGRTSAR